MDKFSHGNNFKNHLFAILSVLLAVVLIAIIIFAFRFLISGINKVVDTNLIKSQDIVKFNLDQLDSLRKK